MSGINSSLNSSLTPIKQDLKAVKYCRRQKWNADAQFHDQRISTSSICLPIDSSCWNYIRETGEQILVTMKYCDSVMMGITYSFKINYPLQLTN